MQLETFRGQELRSVIAWVHRSLGEDALVVRTNVLKRPEGDVYEVVAARPQDMDAYRRTLTEGPISTRIAERKSARPYVVALVGPPGAGKTTAAMKVALHPRGIGGKRVGLVTLDTYRVGAVEEMQTYAEIAGLPLEVVYHAREVEAALERMAGLDVVVVDTPGRATTESAWVHALRALQPDEVHLVLPAGLRLDVARGLRDRLASIGPTHALLTKLDELPGDAGLASTVDALELPVRWLGEGYEVPGRLAPATSRIVRSLGNDAAPAPRLRRTV
jgi:flagellar biosynthesis protein FlhF